MALLLNNLNFIDKEFKQSWNGAITVFEHKTI